MPEAIRYCDKCGLMLKPGEDALGQAVVTDRIALCPTCARALTPEQRARLVPAATAAGAETHPRMTPPPRTGSRRLAAARATPLPRSRRPQTRVARLAEEAGAGAAAAPPQNRNALIMGAVAGAVVLLSIVVGLLLGGSGEPEGSNESGGNGPGGGSRGPQKSEYALTIEIQEKLRKLMAQAQASTSAYEKTRPALRRFAADHAGRPEARTADDFVRQMDAQYKLRTGKSILEAPVPPAP